MSARRGRGEGSVYLRSDGRWVAALTLPTGKRRYLYGKTQAEARRKLRTAERDREAGLRAEPERRTVAQFLTEWLDNRQNIRPLTRQQYGVQVRRISALIGHIRLQALTPEDVQAMVARVARETSPSRARSLRATLGSALRQAETWGIISRNVARLIEAPSVEPREIVTITPEMARAILDAVREHRYATLYTVLLGTGLRISELLGLRWLDVNHTERVIHIRQQLIRPNGQDWQLAPLKTAASRRTIPVATVVLDALHTERRRQGLRRLVTGPDWQDHGLVFTDRCGDPLRQENVLDVFARLLERDGLPRLRLHDLRHGAATIWYAMGIPAKVISAMLGHSRISTTLDTYTHLHERLVRDAADAMDTALRTPTPSEEGSETTCCHERCQQPEKQAPRRRISRTNIRNRVHKPRNLPCFRHALDGVGTRLTRASLSPAAVGSVCLVAPASPPYAVSNAVTSQARCRGEVAA